MVQDKSLIKGLALNDIAVKGGKYVANWRAYKPEIDYEKCVACGLCISYCPEAAINQTDDKMPKIDYRFCKGCGICANECPQKAITMIQEDES
ncbi:MAG: 4Fe-4S binding protein [Candidatus Bathyarchaeota archaeon]|nr:4Fe-4S binding protein [Candidatus Bathyarchaeota archaeon]